MKREKELAEQLRTQMKSMIPGAMKGEKIGSLIFWNDDYGAFIAFAKWKSDEFPWSFPLENNIDLEQFDVFESDDIVVIDNIVAAFYDELRSDPEFLKLPLRKGFQFCNFDTPIGLPLDGIEEQCHYKLEEAIDIIMQYMEQSFTQEESNNFESITFSGEEQQIAITVVDDQYHYHFYDQWDLGFAFTTLIQSAENNFFTLCESLIQNEVFIKMTKKERVEFKIHVDVEEFYEVIYNTNSGKLIKEV